MNAKQKSLTAFFVVAIALADWFFGPKKIDAVVYTLVALLLGISFYGALFLLRRKSK